ncbi:MAG: hypothetical protein AAF199_05150 [Pseudomonadota bacterium]
MVRRVRVKAGSPAICRILAMMAIVFTATGCVTVIDGGAQSVHSAAQSLETYAKRATILDAIDKLAQTPWPAGDKTVFSDRMSAIILGGEKKATDSASPVQYYVASLNQLPAGEQLGQLTQDAQTHLTSARNVEIAIDRALPDFSALREDIVAVESAIASLRDARNIYVASLKMLSQDNSEITARSIAGLKHDFTLASRGLSERADLLAAIVDARDISTPPDPVARTNFVGTR